MQGNNMIPNKPEKIMIELLKKDFPKTFIYTGDGSIVLDGFCPDFVWNDNKKIIEVFGDYWHNISSYKERDKRRFKTYNKYGYEILIIWEHELKDINIVKDRIKEFIFNNPKTKK